MSILMGRPERLLQRRGAARLLPMLSVLIVAGCEDHAAGSDAAVVDGAAELDACEILFGAPGAKTGLGGDRCRPECACGTTVWAPPVYDDGFIQDLIHGWWLSVPFVPLTADPYQSPAPAAEPADTVCAVLPGAIATPRPYTLVTYSSEAEAHAAGASPTHFGRCGLCSTLANLAVYMRHGDLTEPVRSCGMVGMTQGDAANLACLEALGFDRPCAQIWMYNTVHTRTVCLDVCMSELNNPYHRPDGTLNPCLRCDETRSGDIFKAVAGRTRRNSGLPNALCRPCSEVRPLVHSY